MTWSSSALSKQSRSPLGRHISQFPALRPMIVMVAFAIITATSMPIWVLAQSVEPVSLSTQNNIKPLRVSDTDTLTTVEAEQMTGYLSRLINLDNNVNMRRDQTEVKSNKGTYWIVEKKVQAHGSIQMHYFGDKYTGDDLELNTDSGEGFLTNPTYWFQANDAHGSAGRIDFINRKKSKIITGTYTICPSIKPDWYIKSSMLDIDQNLDKGVAYNSIFYFKNVPIFSLPILSFPLSNKRQSGVLPPIIGTTNNGGFEFNLPYYFNIAPNHDLTVYPNIITQRGVKIGAETRYIGNNYIGQTKGEFLSRDRLTKSNRYTLQSIHTQTLIPSLKMGWNVNFASDSHYSDDFMYSLTQSSAQILNREFNLSYSGSFWNVPILVSRYQLLQHFDDANKKLIFSRPYDRLPQISLNAGQQNIYGFDWSINAQYTRFRNNQYNASTSILLPLGGDRLYINPQLSYPIIRPGYFITPKIQLDATIYKISLNKFGISNPISADMTPFRNTYNRVLSTFSLDTGLFFERDKKFFGNPITQTLEPRLFYVYTPFRNQNKFPLFDSAIADFNFTQIFTENRYSGHDRISDANQLTTAITSCFIEKSSIERLRLAIGHRWYFTTPHALLGDTTDIFTSKHSDFLLTANGELTRTLGLNNTIQYSQKNNQWMRASSAIKWQSGLKKVINFWYQLDHNNIDSLLFSGKCLKQLHLSFQWPISHRWYGVSHISYSLQKEPAGQRVRQNLLKLEYKTDCWVFRIFSQRTPISATRMTTAIFVQFELNGLSGVKSHSMQAMRNGIPDN